MEIKSGPGTDYCYILNILHHYRPQRSWGKVVFSQACVILFTGGGSALVHAGILKGLINGGPDVCSWCTANV